MDIKNVNTINSNLHLHLHKNYKLANTIYYANAHNFEVFHNSDPNYQVEFIYRQECIKLVKEQAVNKGDLEILLRNAAIESIKNIKCFNYEDYEGIKAILAKVYIAKNNKHMESLLGHSYFSTRINEDNSVKCYISADKWQVLLHEKFHVVVAQNK